MLTAEDIDPDYFTDRVMRSLARCVIELEARVKLLEEKLDKLEYEATREEL